MKKLLWLVVFFTLFSWASAQQPRMYTLRPDLPVNEQIADSDQYLYPSFRQGAAIFTKPGAAQARFNYNLLLDEMQYISSKNEKLGIANPAELISLQIGNRSFVFIRNGYFEVLLQGKVSLLLKRKAMLNLEGKDIGYGTSSSTSSISSVDFHNTDNGKMNRLAVAGTYRLQRDSTYWIYNGKELFPAGKIKGYLKLFPGHDAQIKQYMQNESPDLLKEDGIRKLLEYCSKRTS